MRTFKYIALGVLTSIGLTSCNLDFPPTSYVATDEYYMSASEVNSGLMGCYNSLLEIMDHEWAVTELRTDNTRTNTTGSTSITTIVKENLDQAKIDTKNSYVDDYWIACWASIGRINLVLDNIENANDDPDMRAQYEGEALFLRSMVYFNLVRLWGPMFKVETTISADVAFDMQRSSVSDIYDMLERDLERVVFNNMLPETYDSTETGRVTMSAAKFLLAKIYSVHYTAGSEEYEVAIELLRDVVGGITTLPVANYADIFDVNNEMNDEIIFAVRYTAGMVGLGSPFANYFAPDNSDNSVVIGDGDGHNYVSDSIIEAFVDGDNRGEGVSYELGYIDVSGDYAVGEKTRYIKKFMCDVEITDDGENDWPIMRMGDATLYLAEMINENYGPTQEAIDYLNMTRTRAGLTPYTMTDLPIKPDFLDAIKAERRVELAFENHRMFDLLRWGHAYAADVISYHLTVEEEFYGDYDYTVSEVAEWELMLPIPYSVISTNPGIAQNTGY